MRPKRFCTECNEKIPSKVWVGEEKKNISHRTQCLKCKPFGAPSYSPNAIKPHFRVVNNAAVTHYRQVQKEKSIAYLGGKCLACKYEKCKQALVFHHIDPAMKSFGIADGRTRRWEIVEAELKKCVLLCNRCHEEVHAGCLDLDVLLQVQDSNPHRAVNSRPSCH